MYVKAAFHNSAFSPLAEVNNNLTSTVKLAFHWYSVIVWLIFYNQSNERLQK